MKKNAQYFLLFIGLIIVMYLGSVFVLFTLPLILRMSPIGDIWRTSIPTSVLALIILLAWYIWGKRRK